MILSLGNQRISLEPVEKTLKKHQEPTGKHHKSTEQVSNIPNQMSPDFSADFRLFPVGKSRKLPGNHEKKIREIQSEILLPCSADFRCLLARTGPCFLT